MPELPEVEVVRAGLASMVLGTTIRKVGVHHERATRRNVGDLAVQLDGAVIESVCRRGKYMWLELDRPFVLMVHLGMSGQIRINDSPLRTSTCSGGLDRNSGRGSGTLFRVPGSADVRGNADL